MLSPTRELDAVLLQLETTADDDEVGLDGANTSHERGCADASTLDIATDGASVLVLHHPGGGGLSASAGPILESDPTHAFYKADTTGGSAGSPVFSKRLRLVALHTAGDLGGDRPGNRGVRGRVFMKLLNKQEQGE